MAAQETNHQQKDSASEATSEAESLMVSSDSPDLEGLTEAELEVLTRPDAKKEDTKEDKPVVKGKAETLAKDDADEPVVKDEAKDEPVEAVGKPTQRDPSFVPRLSDPNAKVRDFDAELTDLDTKLDGGDITAAEYRKAEREIITAQAEFKALAAADARIVASNAQFQTNLLNHAITSFFNDPAHQDFAKDAAGAPTAEWRGAYQKAIDYIDNGSVAPTELAERAYKMMKAVRPDLFTKPAKVDTKADEVVDAKAKADGDKKAIDAATKARKPDMKAVPPPVGEVPVAGQDDDDDTSALDKLADMNIEDLENAMASMKPRELEELLASTPGSKLHAKA